MTVALEREPTAAEREHSPLVVEVERVRQLLEAHQESRPPAPRAALAPFPFEPAVDRLTRLLGLSPFERQVLLLAAAVELDGDVAALVASLQDGLDPRPTFGLALRAFPGAHWDALAPTSPLRRWRLVELGSGPALAARPIRLDERILHYLAGIEAPDERLAGILRPAAYVRLAESQQSLADELARTVAGAAPRVLVKLDGEDADALLDVAQALALALGRVPLVVRPGALPPPGPDLAALARLVDREALLCDGLPVLDGDGAEASVSALVDELESPLAVMLGGGAARASTRLALQRTVGWPSPAEARALWGTALPEIVARALTSSIEEVAEHFRLGAAAIEGIARELATTAGADLDTGEVLQRLCRERARVRLDGLAERIEPQATWDDLVLPPGQIELLREIVRHVRHRTQVYERWGFGERTARGLGVTALFSGESGTGKTLAAEVLAHEFGFDLYRIDLATTVSKYIGETEKNLRRVFAAAEASGAVLLFDEADALFGRRGEVKDGHDRYANLEVAYLLQRMETYRGLAILTTNLRSNVDRAFLRRLRFVVQFPFPDTAQRAEIWRRTFPPATPLDGIDPEQLARLVASGGSIRAIALSSAFTAAADGTPVTRAHVLRAARVEYAKAERAPTESEMKGLR